MHVFVAERVTAKVSGVATEAILKGVEAAVENIRTILGTAYQAEGSTD